MQPLWLCIISGRSFEDTHEKRETNATIVIIQHLRQVIQGHTWKRTLEKSPTNAASVTMHHLWHLILRHTWKYTLEKSRTNATSVSLTALIQALWGLTWKYTVTTPHILSHFRRLAWIRKPFRHNFTNIMSANIDPPPYIHHIFVVSWTGIHSFITFL